MRVQFEFILIFKSLNFNSHQTELLFKTVYFFKQRLHSRVNFLLNQRIHVIQQKNFETVDQLINAQSEFLRLLSEADDCWTLHAITSFLAKIVRKALCLLFMFDQHIIITLLLIAYINCLSYSNSYQYFLVTSNTHIYNFTLQSPTLLTFLQQTGSAKITIFHQKSVIDASQAPFWQYTLGAKHLGRNLSVVIQGREAVGRVQLAVVQQFQTLSFGEQRFIEIGKKEFRVFQIHPRKLTHLSIEKISGVALFTNNRCKSFEKMDCYNQLARLSSITMNHPVQTLQIQYCSNCILLIKVESNGSRVQLRMHINATLTLLDRIPTVSLLKQGQIAKYTLYGKPNFRGKVLNLLGSVKIDSKLKVDTFENGMFYQVGSNHYLQNSFQLVIVGQSKINFFTVQSVQNELMISLKDGVASTIRVQGGNKYTIIFQHNNPGRGNFVISGQIEIMNRLSLHFINKQNNQKYNVRPHYLFNVGSASQNFQLDNSTRNIQIQLRVIQGYGDYLNVSASVNQPLLLALDTRHTDIIGFNEQDHFTLQGVLDPVQIQITKCVKCHLEVQFIYDQEKISEQIIKLSYNKSIKTKTGTLSLVLKTNNYAYYSISVIRLSKNKEQRPFISNKNVNAYLSEPENNLQLQFQIPICSGKQCQNVKYYIVEGSDARHVASRAYCPNSLFDFEEKTKNIVFKQIHPTMVAQNFLSYKQALVVNDWLAVAAQVENYILSYQIVNSGQIRMYKSMRWPIFYFAMFVTLATFLSFVIFMGLKRRKNEYSNGYIRGSSSSEQLD